MDSFAVFWVLYKEVMTVEKDMQVTGGEKLLVYFSIVLLALVAVYFGLGDIISFVILPAILAYTAVRFGALHLLLQAALLVFVYSLASGGYYEPVCLTILPGLVIGISIRNRHGLLYTVSAGSVALLAGEMYLFFSTAIREDVQIGFLESMTYQSTEMINAIGLPARESALLIEMIQTYTPAILLLSMAALSYFIVFTLFLLLKRRAPACVAPYPRFRDFSVSRGSLLLWVVSWGISLFGSGTLSVLFANLATLISSYIILCGYSLAVFYICKVQRGGLRVLLCIALIWLGSLASPLAFFLGGVDAVVHFRTRGGDKA